MNCGKISTGWESSGAFQKKGVPQALANLRTSTNKSKEYRFKKKKSVKKSNPCPPLNQCLNFCPSPQAYGHYIITDIIFPCCRCVPSLRQGHKSKKETRITPRNTDRSFHGFIFWWYFVSEIWILIWIKQDLRALRCSLFRYLDYWKLLQQKWKRPILTRRKE